LLRYTKPHRAYSTERQIKGLPSSDRQIGICQLHWHHSIDGYHIIILFF
jgi:hypothetical protein